MRKAAKNLSSFLRTQGPIRRVLTIGRCSQLPLLQQRSVIMGPPEFTGTTLMLSYAPPTIAQRGRNVPCNPAPDIGGKNAENNDKVSNLA